MQDKQVTTFIMLPVPLEDYLAVGIDPDSILQTYVKDGKLIISKVTADEYCDEICEGCLFYDDCKKREAN